MNDIHSLELALSRAMRNDDDQIAFQLLERLRLARKRTSATALQPSPFYVVEEGGR
ncbi:MAG: hypothetical protein ABI548_25335 [Polyangiaceae bacterium]